MFEVLKVNKDSWKENFSEVVHEEVFGEAHSKLTDRLDYGLIVFKNRIGIGYIAVQENDNEAVYWKWGGVRKEFRNSINVSKGMEIALEWQSRTSKRILMYTENTNTAMLKLCLKYGFLIIGTRHYKDRTMVDLIKEF